MPALQGWYCGTRNPHETKRETVVLFPTRRCVFAEWSYGFAGRSVPVHVDIAASRAGAGERTGQMSMGAVAWPQGAHRVTDALLSPGRRRAVSLGWVRWYGKHGQLVLAPAHSLAGEWGGHLVFYLPPDANNVSYAMTLHASWKSLAQVVATLKALAGSTALAG